MTTPDRALLWRRCALLGRILLPMVDQEPWRQARRHDNLRAWGIGVAEGERLIEVFAALAACAAAEDAALSAAELDGLSLHAVADAATGKADIELLVGLPDTFDDPRDEEAAGFFRLYSYQGGDRQPGICSSSAGKCDALFWSSPIVQDPRLRPTPTSSGKQPSLVSTTSHEPSLTNRASNLRLRETGILPGATRPEVSLARTPPCAGTSFRASADPGTR
ncbi:hypothetical protein [Streptomyces hydrogenans]